MSLLSTPSVEHRVLHSFPTRRSSDLGQRGQHGAAQGLVDRVVDHLRGQLRVLAADLADAVEDDDGVVEDRKSTRLNSSHLVISYAVFCLKKKKKYWLETTEVYQEANE